MKRIILFLLPIFIIGSFSFAASAETLTFHKNLALALQSADMFASDGSQITAIIISTDTTTSTDVTSPDTSSSNTSSDVVTLSLDVSADSVAVIDFSGVDLSVTNQDFESFDVFTGLEKLTIALPFCHRSTNLHF